MQRKIIITEIVHAKITINANGTLNATPETKRYICSDVKEATRRLAKELKRTPTIISTRRLEQMTKLADDKYLEVCEFIGEPTPYTGDTKETAEG